MQTATTLGHNVKHWRTQKQLSQMELCKTTGLSQPYLSQLEAGERKPSLATIERLADALAVPVSALFQVQTEG